MGDAYPELRRAEALITETFKLEESRFRETLARGLKLLDEAVDGQQGQGELPGDVAFKLYDTYGFPLDLTEDALRERGMSVDHAGFDSAMEKQREAARANWSGSGEAATETLWFDLKDETGATEFLGYTTEASEGKIVALIKDGERVEKLSAGEEGMVVANQTPFYGESGGQVGDTGGLFTSEGAEFTISDTQKKLGDLIIHIGTLGKCTLNVGDVADFRVDSRLRASTRANHSATHLAHEALRRVLGDHVSQKGSQVGPDRLRFDFSHPKGMTADEIRQVETIVNEEIQRNNEAVTRVMTPEDAIEAGALALFGEKYGDEVRVLSMGSPREDGNSFSVELCGGTHVSRVGDIGLFKIVSEGAVGSGVRRIEALTAEGARRYFNDQERIAQDAAAVLKIKPEQLGERVAALVDDRKRLERELADAKKKLAMGGGTSSGTTSDVEELGGVKVIARAMEGISAKDLRGMVDDAKKSVGSGIVALIALGDDGKAGIAVGVTDDLTDRLSAVDLVRTGAEALGGKGGGGRPDMAQAGGPDGSKADAALAAIKETVGGLAGAA